MKKKVLVKEIMERPVLVLSSTSKSQLKMVARKHPNTDVFVVVDKKNNFLGDIHENELFSMFIPNRLADEEDIEFGFDMEKKFFAANAKEIMNKHDFVCKGNDRIMDVAKTMLIENLNSMPVINEKGMIVGIVTRGTIVRHL